MTLLTTTIGAYPKPEYVLVPDWFREESTTVRNPTEAYEEYLSTRKIDMKDLLDQATREVVREQVQIGIDIPTDGEIRRENYIHYHCRHLGGIDFGRLTRKVMRSGSWVVAVPTIVGAIQARDGNFLFRDWEVAQRVTDQPVKITVPGPLTITDSVADAYYGDEKKLGQDLAEALNKEIRTLAEAGCEWIQIDEPVFAREPEKALGYGVENLERCFHGVPKKVKRLTHICCGYPDKVDNENYLKADREAYFQLAPALDEAAIDAVSIEDAHRQNDLSLLEEFKKTTVILGVVAIARSRVEPIEEISSRLRTALNHIDRTRLMVAPDCGLGMLDQETVLMKLDHMVRATKTVSELIHQDQ
jgi:5-methyltetrahydropteroyltriglutamate--homocysteine methyltransferase